VQNAWPLDRKPVPLPDDVSLWPTVDVYIPSYNSNSKWLLRGVGFASA